MDKHLPDFIPPMLAVAGLPFDSEEFFFEFKWDGFRTGAYIEGGACRLRSRRGIDMTGRFPSLSALGARLPGGTVLDGEVVLFVDGKPFFEGLLEGGTRQREGTIRFVAFDILYRSFDPVMHLPFIERRGLLEGVTGASRCRELVLSEGLAAHGRSLYDKARELDLEGVMAKRLASPYTAGRRSESWVKIKRRLKAQVVIIGFVEKGADDFKSLLVAGNGLPGVSTGNRRRSPADKLRYMGKVGGGFSDEVKAEMNLLLRRTGARSVPIVSCPEKARWIEPGLYCTVSFTELTSQGLLRAPVFEGLVEVAPRRGSRPAGGEAPASRRGSGVQG